MKYKEGHKGYWSGKKLPKETREKMRIAQTGKKASPETRKKMSESWWKWKVSHNIMNPKQIEAFKRGRIWNLERRQKASIRFKGNKSNLWKDGRAKENPLIRTSFETRLWRDAVFQRDGFTCVKCGVKSSVANRVYLNAHHMKNFSDFQELRFAIDNGITMCNPCHKEFHIKYGRRKNNELQIQEFIGRRMVDRR